MIFILALIGCPRSPTEPVQPVSTMLSEPVTEALGPPIRASEALQGWLDLHLDTVNLVRLPVRRQPNPGGYDGAGLVPCAWSSTEEAMPYFQGFHS